jgi:histidine triad (HIT) family protein
MDCLFCNIANGNIPSYTIYEDDLVRVFLDIHPHVNGHMLIIPKKHYTDIFDIDKELLNYIYKTIAPKMYRLVQEKLGADGISIAQNNGSAQDIKHYHVHLFPRYKHDTLLIDIKDTYNKLVTQK